MSAASDDRFWSLTRELTGNAPADRRLVDTIDAGVSSGRREEVQQMLALWAERPVDADPQQWIGTNLWSSPAFRGICQDIILSQLFGQIFRDGVVQDLPGVTEQEAAALWFSGVFWGLAKAHVPGLPGGYFGHWSYPSEA